MTTRGPAAADLQSTLARQLEVLVARLRAFEPEDWGMPSANPGWTNADAVLHLARAMATFADGVSLGDQPERPGVAQLERPPDARLPAVLAAEGSRLVEALAVAEPTALVWHPSYRFSARTMAAVGLSEVVLHGWDVTGPGERGPEPRPARLVLQGLFSSRDDSGTSPTALLLHVSGRSRIEERSDWSGPGFRWDLPDEVAADRAEG